MLSFLPFPITYFNTTTQNHNDVQRTSERNLTVENGEFSTKHYTSQHAHLNALPVRQTARRDRYETFCQIATSLGLCGEQSETVIDAIFHCLVQVCLVLRAILPKAWVVFSNTL
jgi:hypothetical protein